MKKNILTGLFCLLGLASSFAAEEKFCTANTIPLNPISPYYDGQWQGITVASDGACYFGSASHTLIHGGGFFRFDPNTRQLDILTDDFTKLVGDDLAKYTPQGKCHSPIIERDGVLYFATHLAAYWKDVLDKYAGSYLLGYDIRSREWLNFGINRARFSTYSAVEVDAKRGKAYAMVVPFAPQDLPEGNHLYQIDLKTKERRDLGRLGDGTAAFWFYLDDQGRVWTPIWKGKGQLHCYDPATDKLTTYEDAFPEGRLAPDGALAEKAAITGRCWTWATPIDNGKRCLFTMGDYGGGDERLWLFDPGKDIRSKAAFTPVCYIGNTFLSVALGGDRVYFIQRGDNASSRRYDTEGNRDLPVDEHGYHVNNLHLRSVSLRQGPEHPVTDHGRLIDRAGRTPAYIGSLAADAKGNVFMSGGWTTKPGDTPSLKFIYRTAEGREYAPLEHPGDEAKGEHRGASAGQDFIPLKRGEFFAWVNVSEDLR